MTKIANVLGLSVSTFFLVLIGLIDFFAPWSMSFTVFYLIPVCLGTLCGGKKAGIVFGVLSAIITCFFQRTPYPDIWLGIWNFIIKFGVFLAFTLLLDLYVKKTGRTWTQHVDE